MADEADQLLDLFRSIPQSNTSVNTIPSMRPPPEGIEKYAREGVDLDVTSGAPFLTRATLSFASDDQSRIARVRNAFNNSDVDLTPEGHMIVRNVLDERTGKTKDLLVDEQDISIKDLGDMTSAGLQTLAELFVLKGIGKLKGMQQMGRAKRVLTESGVGAATSETLGGATDIIQRMQDVGSVDLGEVGKQRLQGAAVGFGLGAGLGGASEALAEVRDVRKGVLGGVLAPGESEREGIRALNQLRDENGIDIQPTLGQMAGDENALRLESFMSRIPFIGKMFNAQVKRQEEGVRSLQRKLFGQEPLQPMSDLGADMVETLRPFVDQPGQAVQQIEQSMVLRAADELESAITKIAPSARPFTTEGTSILTKMTARNQHSAFRDKADELFSEVGNPEISTKPLKSLLSNVTKDLPKKTIVTESDLTDAAGLPLSTVEGKAIARELVPSDLLRFLKGLDSIDEAMPLNELRRIRNTVDDAIREGRGLEKIQTRDLKQIQNAITQTIESGVESLEDKAVGAALKRANQFYRGNIERFEVPFIARLLKETPGQPGFIGNFELVREIRSNPDTFRQVEDFLKSTVRDGVEDVAPNNEKIFNVLRRTIMEDVFASARINPSRRQFVDPDRFIADMSAFKPEVRAALLGASEEVVEKNIGLLKQIKEGFKDVDADQLEAFIRTPGNTVHDLSRLVTARKKQREVFENEVVKKMFKGGEVDASQWKSDSALDWILNAKNDADVAQVVSWLSDNPDVTESLRRNVAAHFFQKVARKATPADAVRRDPTELVNPQKLISEFRDPQTQSRLRLVLGNDNFRVLDAFVTAQSVLGKSAGQTLLGTNSALAILKNVGQFLKDIPETSRMLFYATVLTNKGLQRMIREGAMEPATDVRAITTALIASAPMLDAFAQEYGKSGAELALQAISNALSTNLNNEGLNRRSNQTTNAVTEQPAIDDNSADALLELVQ